MLTHSIRCAVCLVALLISAVAAADVKLPSVIASSMVLQREMPVPIWGFADPGEEVTVTFADQSKTATADDTGRWMVKLDALTASAEPRVMTIAGKNKIELKDILVGEVWICSGQSNMEWRPNRILNSKEEIAAAKYPNIRLFDVSRHIAVGVPQDNCPGAWAACTPQSVSRFSAVGYFFGRRLHKELDVPIGLIGSNWGGTRIEPWTPPVGFAAVPELKEIADEAMKLDASTEAGRTFYGKLIADTEAWAVAAKAALAKGQAPPAMPRLPQVSGRTPSAIYNGMIHPLKPFAMRGGIWYQGESNGAEGMSYFHKMQALIKGWRTVFQNDKLAFYYVQLANFRQDTKQPAGGDGWARLREAQRKALSIPNTGMAVAIDIGEARDIHPRNKQDVGWRLAQNALAKTYGKEIVPAGPLYKGFTVDGSSIRISFDHVGGGLMVGKKEGLKPTQEVDAELQRFAIAGADKKWVWAKARIDGDTVVVSHADVAKPMAVRYAWSMNPEGANLYNKEGIPAAPFRTDDWQ